VADRLAEHIGFLREHIWVCETGTVLSAHGGAGLIGVLALPTANVERR
jgi:hypothetical protein